MLVEHSTLAKCILKMCYQCRENQIISIQDNSEVDRDEEERTSRLTSNTIFNNPNCL